MRLPSALLLLALSTASAAAEDFTGFYAGVNAGYAFGRDRTATQASPGPAGAGSAAASGLPPSAADAARQMQAGQRAGTARPAR